MQNAATEFYLLPSPDMGFLNDLILSLSGWNTKRWPRPWDASRPSLYAFIQEGIKRERISDETPFSTCELPDEEAYYESRLSRSSGEAPVRYGPGEEDDFNYKLPVNGIRSNDAVTKEVLVAMRHVFQKPTPEHLISFYDQLIKNELYDYVDGVTMAIAYNPSIVHFPRMLPLMEWLATQAPDRNAVKFAMAMLGFYKNFLKPDIFLTLGRHDEFSRMAVVGLLNIFPDSDPDSYFFVLARYSEGRGRVNAIDHLGFAQDLKIKSWLLREGYKTSFATTRTNLICAEAGELKSELERSQPDEAVMAAAAKILYDLIRQGEGPDIVLYDNGAEASLLYLKHLNERKLTSTDIDALSVLKEFVENVKHDWGTLADKGWTEYRRSEVLTRCRSLLP